MNFQVLTNQLFAINGSRVNEAIDKMDIGPCAGMIDIERAIPGTEALCEDLTQ